MGWRASPCPDRKLRPRLEPEQPRRLLESPGPRCTSLPSALEATGLGSGASAVRLWRGPFLLDAAGCLLAVFSGGRRSPGASSYEDTCPIRSGPTLTAPFHLDHLLRAPSPVLSQGAGLQRKTSGTVQRPPGLMASFQEPSSGHQAAQTRGAFQNGARSLEAYGKGWVL